jgi:hypothetical protein
VQILTENTRQERKTSFQTGVEIKIPRSKKEYVTEKLEGNLEK